jgi:hypothetical protein
MERRDGMTGRLSVHFEGRRSHSFWATFGALLCAAALAGAAFGATDPEQTREGYVAQAEPICKTNTKANERIFKGVRKLIRQGKLKLAAAHFAKAAAAFGKATSEIAAVPQPVPDAARLNKWIGLLRKERSLLAKIGAALRAGKKARAQRLSVKLTHNGNTANNTVLGFEFHYCLIDSSRFT